MDKEQFRYRLEEELATIDEEIEENTGADDEDDSATEMDEVADKIEDREEEDAENNVLGARRKDVVAALEKLDKGTYGVCEIGGEPIEEARLEADPAARTCIAHKDE